MSEQAAGASVDVPPIRLRGGGGDEDDWEEEENEEWEEEEEGARIRKVRGQLQRSVR